MTSGDDPRERADGWFDILETTTINELQALLDSIGTLHARLTAGDTGLNGLALGGPGDVIASGPRPGLQPGGTVRPVRLALVGREPRVPFDLPADGGRVPAQHAGHRAHAGPVSDLDLDDLPFLFRQVRIYFSHRCNILRTGYLDNLQSNGCCTFI